MRSHILLASTLALPALVSAQPLTGSAGGTLSPRTHFLAFYQGSPPDATIKLLLVLRGQPGWQTGGPSGQAGSGRSSATAGRGPLRYTLAVGAVHFECVYDAARQILTYNGSVQQIDSSNVVVIDRIDGVGGPPQTLRLFTLTLPAYRGGPEGVVMVREIREVQEYLR